MNAAFAVRFRPPVFFFDPLAAFLAVFFAMSAPSASARSAPARLVAQEPARRARETTVGRLSPEPCLGHCREQRCAIQSRLNVLCMDRNMVNPLVISGICRN